MNNKWFELGIELGVEYHELQGIQQTANPAVSVSRLMIDMLERWLTKHTSRSWRRDIIKALINIGVTALAGQPEFKLITNESLGLIFSGMHGNLFLALIVFINLLFAFC